MRIGVGLGITRPKTGIFAPAGFTLLVDADGSYLTDSDGYFLVEAI